MNSYKNVVQKEKYELNMLHNGDTWDNLVRRNFLVDDEILIFNSQIRFKLLDTYIFR